MRNPEQIEEKLRQCKEGASAPNDTIGKYFKAWKDALEWVLEKDNGDKK